MSELSRRGLMGAAAAVTGAAAVNAALPGVSAAATPASGAATSSRRHGDIRDVEHVVVIMQENRSFDHYFGSLKGVRGFGDRSTILLPGDKSVWEQPVTPTAGAATQFPWRLSGARTWSGSTPPSPELGAANYGGTSHGWDDQHAAWYGGLMNGWFAAKGGPTTLGYLDRHDLPFHYALADAYTVGDAYHCSVLSATGPNRTYLWSGTI
ncbi:MAG TPA: alkaline phosphatase family protein, partial [Actinopolymorphaceae bacterium]|nr:alkaline phosphatase family protein [Actinopolymorphaceae bacterium]